MKMIKALLFGLLVAGTCSDTRAEGKEGPSILLDPNVHPTSTSSSNDSETNPIASSSASNQHKNNKSEQNRLFSNELNSEESSSIGDQVIPEFLLHNPLDHIEHRNQVDEDENLYSSIIEHKRPEELGEYTYDKLFLDEDLQQSINAHVADIQSNDPARAYSLIFDGPPGVGKTFLGHVIAQELKCDFLYSCAADYEGEYYGNAQKIIRYMFTKANQLNKPIVIFIDELEALAGSKQINDRTNVYKNACRSLWTKLDPYKRNKNALVIVAVNEYEKLPEQLKGRFCDHITFKNPSEEHCKQILQMYYKKFNAPKKLSQATLDCVASSLVGLDARSIRAIAQKTARIVKRKNDSTIDDLKKVIALKRIEKGIESTFEKFQRNWFTKKAWSNWYDDGGVSRTLHNTAIILNVLAAFQGDNSTTSNPEASK